VAVIVRTLHDRCLMRCYLIGAAKCSEPRSCPITRGRRFIGNGLVYPLLRHFVFLAHLDSDFLGKASAIF
jgi:hypothetical protein